MEGENKNMKMKKLTALALAGALCMGMSTVALAAPSVGPKDAITATTENGTNVELNKDEIDVNRWNEFDGWDSTNPEKASDAIKDTFEQASVDYEKRITELKQKNDPKLAGVIAEYEKQQAALNTLVESDDLIEVATLVDLSVAKDENGQILPVDPEHPLMVKFVLNNRLENLAVGQKIRIMHQNSRTLLWEVYEGEVKWDAVKSEFYVENEFTSLSPVAILRVTSDGSVQVTPPGEQPGNTNQPGDQPTVTPDKDGNVTADQLADLIAKKLQTNGVKFDRTAATGKASPKTGE